MMAPTGLIVLDNLQPIKTVEKVWGVEKWLVNNKDYCAKILEVKEGFRCSLHYHPRKHETFIVLRGSVRLEFCGNNDKETVTSLLIPGQTKDIPPFSGHRFSSEFGAIVLEISTHHDDDDVVRIKDSGPIPTS